MIAKTATKSGDAQTGTAGQALPSALRVVVTRDGTPEPDVAVTWSAAAGGIGPSPDQTDANGESTSLWVLGDQAGPQSASASVTGATGSPVTFTATALSGPAPVTVQVLGPTGGNRFDPADISVATGTTVTWEWGDGALDHSVVAGRRNDAPQQRGGRRCAAFLFVHLRHPWHLPLSLRVARRSGGGGMSGTVTVTSQF